MNAIGAKIALVRSAASLGCNGGSSPCSWAQRALIVDHVGWGSANFSEGSPGPTTANTTALIRRDGGCTDTGNNAADFTTGAPMPRNTASTNRSCGGAEPPPPPPPPPPPLSVTLTLDRETVRPGDVLRIGVSAANPGATVVTDVYLRAMLPPAAGPDFGCPDDDAVVFLTDGGATIVLACASDPAGTFPAYFSDLTIPAGFTINVPNFLSLVWPHGAPAGPYTIEIFGTPPGALADGELGAADIVAASSDTLTFEP
jgi:hypothetical protein